MKEPASTAGSIFALCFGSVLRLGVGLLLRTAVGLGFSLHVRGLASRALAGSLLGVIGHVPTGALELDGGSGQHLLDGVFAAGRALVRHGVGELLDLFKAMLTGFAQELVKGHGKLLFR